MSIEITCKCGQVLEVPEEYIGQTGECPECGASMPIVAPESATVEASSPQVEKSLAGGRTDPAEMAAEAKASESTEPAESTSAPTPQSPKIQTEDTDATQIPNESASSKVRFIEQIDDIDSLYYHHSGKVPIPGLIIGVCGGAVSAVIVGIIYTVAVYYIPLVYVNFFLTVLCGMGVGVGLAYSFRFGKVRNNVVLGIAALVFGLITVYISWNVWICLLAKQVGIIMPWGILDVAGNIAKDGLWSIFKFKPTGYVLYLIWLIEAGIIICMSVGGAMMILFSLPFCEDCNRWASLKVTFSELNRIPDEEEFIYELEKGNFSVLKYLQKLTRVADKATGFARVDLRKCDNCNNLCVLTVKDVTFEVNDDGDEEEKERIIIENLLIHEDVYKELRAHW